MLMNRSSSSDLLEPEVAEPTPGYGRQSVQGVRPGDRYVRVLRPPVSGRPSGGPGLFVRRPRESASDHPAMHRIAPDADRAADRDRARARGAPDEGQGAGGLSSDALSSVAYATEEIMKIAVLGGVAALSYTLPISLVIVALLFIVVVSYRQTIRAYPSGGGSYIVASSNLGPLPGLTGRRRIAD